MSNQMTINVPRGTDLKITFEGSTQVINITHPQPSGWAASSGSGSGSSSGSNSSSQFNDTF